LRVREANNLIIEHLKKGGKMKPKKKICPDCKKEIKEKTQGFCQDPEKKCGCRKKKITDIGFGFCK